MLSVAASLLCLQAYSHYSRNSAENNTRSYQRKFRVLPSSRRKLFYKHQHCLRPREGEEEGKCRLFQPRHRGRTRLPVTKCEGSGCKYPYKWCLEACRDCWGGRLRKASRCCVYICVILTQVPPSWRNLWPMVKYELRVTHQYTSLCKIFFTLQRWHWELR